MEKMYHVGFDDSHGAKYAILPGDPGRVEKMGTYSLLVPSMRMAALATTRSPPITGVAIPPQVPMRIRVRTPVWYSSSTPMAVGGPPEDRRLPGGASFLLPEPGVHHLAGQAGGGTGAGDVHRHAPQWVVTPRAFPAATRALVTSMLETAGNSMGTYSLLVPSMCPKGCGT